MSTHKYNTILALGLSVALHALILAAGLLDLGLRLDVPKFEIEFDTIEFQDPNLAQGDVEVATPGPQSLPPIASQEPVSSDPDNPTQDPEAPAKPEEKPEEKPKEKPRLGDKTAKLEKLGPPSSTFFILLATKRIAKLPFAERAADIMAPLPDFEFIIQGGGFHPWRDFNAIIIASSDIRDMTQTFLAVESRLPQSELQVGLEVAAAKAGEQITWETRNGVLMGNPRPIDPRKPDLDPRWFIFLPDNVGIYVREEFLDSVIAGPNEKRGKTAGNFVANISRMKSFLAKEPRSGMQLTATDLRAALKRATLPIAVPNHLEIVAEAAAKPEIVIKLEFMSSQEAKQALAFWRGEIRDAIFHNPMLGLTVGGLYNSTEAETDGKMLQLRNQFNTTQAELLLGLLADQSASMMRRSKDQMQAAKTERQRLWDARQSGKLTPSQVRELEAAKPGKPPNG